MSLESFKSYFETELEELIQRKYTEKTLLNEAVIYALRGQGKRVRPLLVFLVNDALKGKKEKPFLQLLLLRWSILTALFMMICLFLMMTL